MLLVPHHFRRRLLLPVGWVALGCCLLLGCLVVQAQWRRLRPLCVMQVTMPTLHQPLATGAPYSIYFSIQNVRQQVRQVPQWQELDFRGRPTDSLVVRRVGRAVQSLRASLQTRRGVVIRFAPGTRYTYLVAVLDLLNQQEDIKRYALDNSPAASVLYIWHPRFVAKKRRASPHQILPPVTPLAL